ncbi:MAG TPA: hypothetical protein PK135_13825, partial [Arenimonas sp.]|nr:hypothetical protein [Arenimonas sp.]
MASIKKIIFSGFILALILATANITSAKPAEATTTVRPSEWATPLAVVGLPNLHRVDINLYRSAQPLDGSGEALKKLGIKTVLN